MDSWDSRAWSAKLLTTPSDLFLTRLMFPGLQEAKDRLRWYHRLPRWLLRRLHIEHPIDRWNRDNAVPMGAAIRIVPMTVSGPQWARGV